MKILNKVMMGAAALVLLTGCSSMKKVDAKTFVEKAEAAWKDVPYTKVTVNGTVEIKIVGSEQKVELKNIELPLKDGTIDADKLSQIDMGDKLVEYDVAAMMVVRNAFVTGQSYLDASEEEDNPLHDVEINFYVGNGFKVTLKQNSNEASLQWDRYGMMTKMKQNDPQAGNVNLTAKYSK